MARPHKKSQAKTFQQRQAERAKAAARDRELVEEMASAYSCSNSIARDFADQCELRIDDLRFDLHCSQLALDFWASPPRAAEPVIALLRELTDERRRHQDALANLRERLLETTKSEVHQHLELPIEHYQRQIRDQLFPDR